MPKGKGKRSKRTSVEVGNISNVSGNVNVAVGDITTYHSVTGLDLESETIKIEETRMAGDTSTDAPPPEGSRRKKKKGK